MEPIQRQSAVQLLERDFVEYRSRLLEIAAFLDRIGRYEDEPQAKQDIRYLALLKILQVLSFDSQDRAETILLLLSDPTLEPVADKIPPEKALGAWRDPGGG